MRIHPAIVAQAAATTAAMMPGRFFLGVGTGENLNEHVLGDRWPSPDVRLEMLEEAVEVIRLLWQGGVQTHRGKHYTVENARLYTLPDEPPDDRGRGRRSRTRPSSPAGSATGSVNTSPDAELVERYEAAGGDGKPKYGELNVCWAEDEARARRLAHELWPIAALTGGTRPGACRRPVTSSRRSSWSARTTWPRRWSAAPTRSATSRRSASPSGPATRTSGSTRSATTSASSWTSTCARSCPGSRSGLAVLT